MLTGKELIDDINSCVVGPGQCGLWWLGQHSFVVKLGQTVVYIDPFLTDMPDRQVRPLLKPADITNAALVLGSHDHIDHIDRPALPAIATASPAARFIVPKLLREKIVAEVGLPADRVLGVDERHRAEVEGVKVVGVPAAHELLDTDPATGLHPYLGFVVESNGFRLYHAGDCCIYEGIYAKIRRHKPDLMILPINGRDSRRFKCGCIGNMTYQEAADLAGALRPRVVIPAHYEMFAMNSADVAEFMEYMRVKYPAQMVLVPAHGQRTVINLNCSACKA